MAGLLRKFYLTLSAEDGGRLSNQHSASLNSREIKCSKGAAKVLIRSRKGWRDLRITQGDVIQVAPFEWVEIYPAPGGKAVITDGEITDFATFLKVIRGPHFDASAHP